MIANDTIAAIATAPGRSFRAVVRLSGAHALAIASKLVVDGPRPDELSGYSAPEVVLDVSENRLGGDRRIGARLLVMRGPYSYTAEDVVEFFVPGSPPLAGVVLIACLERGARLAGPGEFTRRAYVNGRIDAVQVEGVLALIESSGDDQRAAAMERLRGRPTQEAEEARKRLLDVLAAIEAYVDFTDEDTEALDIATLRKELAACRDGLDAANRGLERRRAFRNLPGVVILGAPNAGKSSLFRALVPGGKTVVSSVPGTTRDLIEGEVTAGNRAFRLYDAPGVMETDDPLERLALDNLEGMMSRVQACLVLLDGSTSPDRALLNELARIGEGRPCVFALGKSDLEGHAGWSDFELPGAPHPVSAHERRGLEELLDAVAAILPEPLGPAAASLDLGIAVGVTRAQGAIEIALAGDWDAGLELVAFEIREAFDSLSLVFDRVTDEELLNEVFSRFCIGK